MDERKRELLIKIEQLDAIVELLRRKYHGAHVTEKDIQELLREIEDRILSLSAEAEAIERAKVTELARRRVLVLGITTFIEILVALAIAPFEKTIAKYAAVYAFAPLVSAVAGNFGLQTAAIVIRSMALGLSTNKWKTIARELLTGALCGLVIGVIAGAVAYLTTLKWEALVVIPLALLVSMTVSGFFGSAFPQLAKALGFDPAIVAGPMETAAQDLAGYVVFLSLLTLLSRFFG